MTGLILSFSDWGCYILKFDILKSTMGCKLTGLSSLETCIWIIRRVIRQHSCNSGPNCNHISGLHVDYGIFSKSCHRGNRKEKIQHG